MEIDSITDPQVIAAGIGGLMILVSLLRFEEHWWLATLGAALIGMSFMTDILLNIF